MNHSKLSSMPTKSHSHIWGRPLHLKESPNSEELAQHFTGKEWDRVSGLDYFGARYCDSDVGYWLSPDAARQFGNLYLYSGNGFSPLNGVDKKGNWFIYDTKNVILFNSCEMGVSCSDLRMSQFEGTRAQYMNPSSGEGRFTGETNIADISMSLNLKAGDKFEDAWDGAHNMLGYGQLALGTPVSFVAGLADAVVWGVQIAVGKTSEYASGGWSIVSAFVGAKFKAASEIGGGESKAVDVGLDALSNVGAKVIDSKGDEP